MKSKSTNPLFGKTLRLVSALILAALIISACQPAAASSPAAPTSVPTTAPAAVPPTAPPAEPTTAPTAVPTTPPTVAPTATPVASPTPSFNEPSLSVFVHPSLGEILIGDNGLTLYIFTKDEPGKSNCNPDCLTAWPPLLTQGSPSLGAGIDPALVGTATLTDGSLIVTYNQMPLYYYANDVQPGDVTGQEVGGVWYVLSPAGTVIKPQPTNPPPSNDNSNDDKGYDY